MKSSWLSVRCFAIESTNRLNSKLSGSKKSSFLFSLGSEDGIRKFLSPLFRAEKFICMFWRPSRVALKVWVKSKAWWMRIVLKSSVTLSVNPFIKSSRWLLYSWNSKRTCYGKSSTFLKFFIKYRRASLKNFSENSILNFNSSSPFLI